MVRIGHVASVAGVVVLLALVAPFVVTGAPAVVGAEESYVVLSGSMKPTIQPGDIVITRDVEPTAVEEGDVITYTRPSMDAPVTHRVIGVSEQEGQLVFQTKGDGNEDPDAYTVTGEQVIGRVWFTMPKIGYVVTFANSTRGFLVLVLAPLALLALSEAWAFATGGDDESDADQTPAATLADPDRTAAAAGEESGDDAEDPEDGSPTVTLDENRLFGALAITGPAAAGLGYHALQTEAAWAVTGTYLSAALFLVAGALLVRLRRDDGTPETPQSGGPDAPAASVGASNATDGAGLAAPARGSVPAAERSVRGSVPDDLLERPVVTVQDPDRLATMAAADGRWIVADPEREARFLVGDDVVYRDPTWSPPATAGDEHGDAEATGEREEAASETTAEDAADSSADADDAADGADEAHAPDGTAEPGATDDTQVTDDPAE